MRRALKANYGSAAMLVAGIFNASVAIATPRSLATGLLLGASLASIASAGFFIGRWQVIDAIAQSHASLPKKLNVDVKDDGSAHAIVETYGGDLVSLDVPEEVVDDGPMAITAWVAHELMSE